MSDHEIIELSQPQLKGQKSVEEALNERRTIRYFSDQEIQISQVSQLLWALQGIIEAEELPSGETLYHRTAPSAGRRYPLEVYVVLLQGIYHYEPIKHELHKIINEEIKGDPRINLSEAPYAPFNKEAIQTAPLSIIVACDNQKSLKGNPLMEKALITVHLEAGHATQNLILQAASFGMGACTMTSYDLGTIYKVLKLPMHQKPIYLIPIGYPTEDSSPRHAVY
ncbi:MAG: SagB family peptide dehydrogenase [Candidatus Thorarchaeota archaeon]